MLNSRKKNDEMKQYEEETGKHAIWQGKATKGFIRWKEGRKDYYFDQKRVSVYISNESEKKWKEFMKFHKFPSFSKLIRESVNHYINQKSRIGGRIISVLEKDNMSNIVHTIKEKLTTIKGFSQLALEKYHDRIDDDLNSILSNVIKDIKDLENKFITRLDHTEIKTPQYDILLIEDDLSTLLLLKKYFENKGYSLKGVQTGVRGIEELRRSNPRLILLDIILPDISGYDLCKDIKTHESCKHIPVFYLTAVSGDEVTSRMKDTMADGYILKPFDLPELEFLFNYLQT